MKAYFPGGHSREEVLASIKWMYRKGDRAYELISRKHTNEEDLELMQLIINGLRNSDWGKPPHNFAQIQDEITATLARLIGPCKRIIKTGSDLLALHFLAAFHLTEVALDVTRPKARCLLAVDGTSSGNLCLSMGLYRREEGVWDAVVLKRPDWWDHQTGCHDYARPFVTTDLKESEYFWNGTGSESSFNGAIRVVARREGTCILRPIRR
jgi:hypothetical protein